MAYADRIAAREELKKHEGWRVHFEIGRLDAVWYAYRHNTDSLLGNCERSSRELECVGNADNQQLREWLHKAEPQLFRWLLNYGAATLSLVDFSRNLARSELPKGALEEYQNLVDTEIRSSVECSVLNGLRNYTQHANVPGLMIEVFAEPGDRRLHLTKRSLLRHKKPWTPRAAAYIQSRDAIDVALLAKNHLERAQTVFAHLRAEVLEHHANKLRDFYARYDRAIMEAQADGVEFESVLVTRYV